MANNNKIMGWIALTFGIIIVLGVMINEIRKNRNKKPIPIPNRVERNPLKIEMLTFGYIDGVGDDEHDEEFRRAIFSMGAYWQERALTAKSIGKYVDLSYWEKNGNFVVEKHKQKKDGTHVLTLVKERCVSIMGAGSADLHVSFIYEIRPEYEGKHCYVVTYK